jgi:formate dehydrogenase iron-sulfur subunit
MEKTPEGPVIYDRDKCMGCRYCIVACPFGIPRYDWDRPVPYVQKCDMCYGRLKEGKPPACVEACPEKATIFGPRSELLEEARRRIRTHPGRYVNRVVGETEIGGTSVLYLSDVPLDFLGFAPKLGEKAVPEFTWAALSKVPVLLVGMGTLVTGLWWLIGRRNKLAMERAQEAILSGNEQEQDGS